EILNGLDTIMGKNGFKGDMKAFVAAFGDVTFVSVASKSLGTKGAGFVVADADYATGIIRVTPNAGTNNIIHEMGHIFDGHLKRYNSETPKFSNAYKDLFNGDSGATKDYGQGNTPTEDFADSFLAVIAYGNQAKNKIDQPRIDNINMLISLYTNAYP
ncbi:MAG: hypothetical protein PHQ36_07440, partial [Anaerolineales bacterium]|nr:hypothetical protein [Anaerolineales bacterium]